jgi:hypothetical protein
MPLLDVFIIECRVAFAVVKLPWYIISFSLKVAILP